jgi:hypothetical protein
MNENIILQMVEHNTKEFTSGPPAFNEGFSVVSIVCCGLIFLNLLASYNERLLSF